MKKVLIVIIMLILLTGCELKTEKETNKKEELPIPEVKNYTKDIVLSSNSETKYKWEYEIELIDSEEDPKTYIELKKEHGRRCTEEKETNCPEVDIFNLKGLKQGKLKITFKYTYTSKKKKHVTKTAIYYIEIDKELNVLETSHEGDYFRK
jgi:predicted secreted protein